MKLVAKTRPLADTVRASRDGHEFHEAWTARRAMQLLWPECDLTAIAVENLSPVDQRHASAAASEIADVTLYYGATSFKESKRTTIAQFKYSIARGSVQFRAADIKKTIAKFAQAYKNYRATYGPAEVKVKLDFEFITNRPVYPPLLEAIEALSNGFLGDGEVARQARQVKAAAGLNSRLLVEFASKCRVVALAGSLTHTKGQLAGLVVDWSASSDPLATARLGQLRQLVRDKAGSAGAKDNCIRRTDILAALEIADADDLLPCKPALPAIGQIVEREQLAEALAEISKDSAPHLIHATGGVGKTVFMTSLAGAMRDQAEVVFFDCFGGGAYRSVEDARHLPKRGLVHIANTLAFRGLCDPILPGNPDVQALLSAFRRRLEQCVKTINTATPGRGVTLFIDAIDNAELVALERSEYAFPILLLESLHYKPIAGIRLVVACRTERLPATTAPYKEFELRPFSIGETSAYLRPRLRPLTETEIRVAQARSGGNPRVLEYLVKSGRGLLDESQINHQIALTELIEARISDALATARDQGYPREDIAAFLAGLAVLPPPVPLDEYAGAHGLKLGTVESFAADLSPLLERTNQGLMFRDEPTETIIRENYASSREALQRVAANLLARQELSVYAARALPGLLHKIDDGDQLFTLAFDDRTPAAITTTVGKRNIRYARLKAAVLHAALKQDHNRLVQLLVELSSVASLDQRGANYILDYPDLVVAARDVDATRRLFEIRTGWPGSRHARLAIANTLAGEADEAYRHAVATQEWIDHYRRTERKEGDRQPQPERIDIAAIPFFLLCERKPKDAARFLKGWRDWYAYEVCENVLRYLGLAQVIRPLARRVHGDFLSELTDVGPLAAALSFAELGAREKKDLLGKLYRACRQTKELDLPQNFPRERIFDLQHGLRHAAGLAMQFGLRAEALSISGRAPARTPSLWALRDHFYLGDEVFPFVFRTALAAAAKSAAVHEKDVVPAELVPVCRTIGRDMVGGEFRKETKRRIPKFTRGPRESAAKEGDRRTLSHEQKGEAERFLDHQLTSLTSITQALADLLGSPAGRADRPFGEVLRIWKEAQEAGDPYSAGHRGNLFRFLGLEVAVFALGLRADLKPVSVKKFLTTAHAQNIAARTLVGTVAILSKRSRLHVLAGEEAVRVRTLIEAEDDVTHRASLLGDLGRAILPASIDEAALYFRDGLEQMDAIGSGDYAFTNELLLFAGAIKGEELDESALHTLSNICELNMGEEAGKFVWCPFAKAMARMAGIRGLAKLSRWDDRSKIGLDYTLLPYLTALVEDGKITAEIALCLNRLAGPVELWHCGTKELASTVAATNSGRPEIVAELIQQYEDNSNSIYGSETAQGLATLAKESLGSNSETAKYFAVAGIQRASLRDELNDQRNYRGVPEARLQRHATKETSRLRAEILSLATATNPLDPNSLANATMALAGTRHAFDLKDEFFGLIRVKVPFKARADYIRHIAALDGFSLYWKLDELAACRKEWARASAGFALVLREVASALVRLHADDLVSHGTLSGYHLNAIAELTGVSIASLAIDVVEMFARPDASIPAAAWLGLASLVVQESDEGQGQLALTRLLRSEAARLTDRVPDGTWKSGLYPSADVHVVVAGLVWRMLGSPDAEGRWRAAHSVRRLSSFRRWEVVDVLVAKLSTEETAGPFQASELTFYFLHARLWLLIALARISLDYPKEVSRYKDSLLSFIDEVRTPHVLMRHFAARALLACMKAGDLTLPPETVERLRTIDASPYQRSREKTNRFGFYQGRPTSGTRSKAEFRLDYDFHKMDVDSLASVFGRSTAEVADMMAETVCMLAPTVSSMHETGGRLSPTRDHYGLTNSYHIYGQQLGWHALFFAAARLLREFPVTGDGWGGWDRWEEWLGQYLLTRDDGLWLSDGMDRRPLDTEVILRERGKKGLLLTGDREKLLNLIGVRTRVGRDVVVDGLWNSADGVRVRISSALVSPASAQKLARRLTRENPMRVWLPEYAEDDKGNEYLRSDTGNRGYTPWIVQRSREARLDEYDPFGAACANGRSRLASEYSLATGIVSEDAFGRTWHDAHNRIALRSQAWGRDNRVGKEGSDAGLRLLCSRHLLKAVLAASGRDLLVLINLELYESKSYPREQSRFVHTVAVVRVTRTLNLEYFPGRVSHIYESRY